jgi:hypothetical protein
MTRRVRSQTVVVQRGSAGLVAVHTRVEPTPERLTHGILEPAGEAVRALSQIEEMARAGELGDEVVPLLQAARYLSWLGELARLRSHPEAEASMQAIAARRVLARLHEAIGAEGLSVLLDACVFDQPIALPRRPALRVALQALATWRKRGTS